MRKANTLDFFLLLLLGAIWGSSFFNIKIATLHYEPITLATIRVFFAAIPLLLWCKIKKIRVLCFSKEWKSYALIGLCNIVLPFIFIAIGTNYVDSYLAAILMSTTPISGSILAHFFTQNEKINFIKTLGIMIGFSGVILLFFDDLIINSNNIFFAIIILIGSTFYSIAGVITLKLFTKHKNENVTTSTMIWSLLFLIPLSLIFEDPLLSSPDFISTLSLIYLGVVATGIAWMIRFYILTNNGLVFQTQVAYLIPIFGVIFGNVFLNEEISWKVIVSLIIILIGIFIVKNNNIIEKKTYAS